MQGAQRLYIARMLGTKREQLPQPKGSHSFPPFLLEGVIQTMTKVWERLRIVACAMVTMIFLLAFPLMLPNQIFVQTFPIANTVIASRSSGFCVSCAKPLEGVGRRYSITSPFGTSPLRKHVNTISSYIGNNKNLPFHHPRSLINTALLLSQRRGLEVRTTGGATPTEGGMTLYLKAGPDGSSVGDCPFAHFVRMVLEEKGLEYELRPCGSNEAKPAWLLEHYGGSMPALRHRQECYIESDVIAQYLDFFFQEPPLSAPNKKTMKQAGNAIEGLFPAIAKFLKHTSDDEVEELNLKEILMNKLTALEGHLSSESRTGPYLVGDGEQLTLLDCSLAPKLYHLKVATDAFKKGKAKIDISAHFPHLHKYMEAIFARPSFVKTVYPEETVIWGWENARNKQ